MKCFVVKVREGNDRCSYVFQQRKTSLKKKSKLSCFKKLFQPFSEFTRCTWMHHEVPLCVSKSDRSADKERNSSPANDTKCGSIVCFFFVTWLFLVQTFFLPGSVVDSLTGFRPTRKKKCTHIRPLAESVSDSYSYNCIHASCRNCVQEENKAYCVSAIENLRIWWQLDLFLHCVTSMRVGDHSVTYT